jgi:hypothetical protein
MSSSLAKIGRHDPHIAEVRAAQIRVVDGEHITRADVIAEGVDHGLGREVQRPDVHGNVRAALHHRVAIAIAQRGGEVTGVHHE